MNHREGLIILLKNLEKGNWKGRLKELSLRTNFEDYSDTTYELSEEVAEGIKNVLSKFSISCLKLTGTDYFNYITGDLLSKLLKENTSLEELHLNEYGIDDWGAGKIAKELENNRSLKILNFSRNQIGNEGSNALAKALKKNENLVMIDLSENKIGDQGVGEWPETLDQQRSIQLKLNLDFNEIGEAGKTLLVRKAVSLNSQKCDRAIEQIKNQMKEGNVLNIDVSKSQIGNIGIKKIIDVLQGCSSLISLDLHGNEIRDEEVKRLTKLLEKNPNLEELLLFNNRIGDEGLFALLRSIKANSSLRKLWLGNNFIGDKGLDMIVSSLSEHKNFFEKIAFFSLSDNQIGDKGLIAFSMGIEINIFLELLNLSNNQIGDVGATALAKALKGKIFLEKLDLSNNQIGDVGAKTLAKVLREFRGLSLDLRNNPIEDEEAIKNIWKEDRSDRSLKRLFLGKDGDNGATL